MKILREFLDLPLALSMYFDDLFGYPWGMIILLCIVWGLAGFCFVQAVS